MVMPYENLESYRQEHDGKEIVLVNGVYDIVHPGHAEHLRVAKQIGDLLVVAVWNDACVTGRKGPGRPINTAADRMAVIDAFGVVDAVFEVPHLGRQGEAIMPSLRTLQPDRYLISSRKHQIFDGAAAVAHPSGRETSIVYDLSYGAKRHSSTDIINRVLTAGYRT